jgi:glutamate racemase
MTVESKMDNEGQARAPFGVGPAPLGVFDSGLGGITVVGEILRLLPGERIVYIGDTAHVPYGPRPHAQVRDFSLAIGRYLTRRAGCRAVVIACNTATGPGAEALRAELTLPIVGMEPAVKPAVAATRTGRVGVLATVSTLTGDRYAQLVERFAGGVEVISQPCPGLVECVERGDLSGPEARALVSRYVAPLVAQGVDTLVLGCTHYPLLRPLIAEAAGPGITLIDTGPAVARQVARVAGRAEVPDNDARAKSGTVRVLTTGGGREPHEYAALARRFLAGVGITDAKVRAGRLFWEQGELNDDAGQPD